ncbi:MAG: ABC transporter ATP-binding protein [Leadbetterella sp.]|nr:ABC transporter ATP-binding protein [Leadbetterella sp.]
MKNNLLQLKNITVEFENVVALSDVSLSIGKGEIVSLIGPNGSGKSTVLKTAFGLVGIKSGKVLWNNQEITLSPDRMAKIGFSYVPQGKQIFPNLTVQENLEIGGYVIRDKKIIQQKIADMTKLFPILLKKMDAKASSLSGGQQQLLALARGLMTGPEILLLDEPSLGLSPKMTKELFSTINDINKKYNTTTLIVEHNIRSLLKISNRYYILNGGKIIEASSTHDIEGQAVLKKILSDG